MLCRCVSSPSLGTVCSNIIHFQCNYTTMAVQWETRKVVLRIVCTTDVIVCRVCEDGVLELPIEGIGTPAAHIGT
jgi:hypothetical protein